MKAITNELHTALIDALLQIPMGQVEQLVGGLRSAVDVPPDAQATMRASAVDAARQQLTAQLSQLAAVAKGDLQALGALDGDATAGANGGATPCES